MTTSTDRAHGALHRTLSFWGALGLSVALLGPSMAVNINPQAPAKHVGRAVPLVFLISTAAVLLVAYAFIRLCQHFAHAGSVYGLVSATLGPRTGFLAGWLLLGTYLAFTVTTLSGSALFLTTFAQDVGLWAHPDWLIPAGIAVLLLVLLATRPAALATKVLLGVEIVTMLLILAISVIVVIRLSGPGTPGGHSLTASVFTLDSRTPISGVFFAMTFGFLSFAGFEAAATLGEETVNPRRAIPRALLGTVLLGGLFFVFVTATESMGFGTGSRGTTAFIGSSSLMGDLARTFLNGWSGHLVTLGAGISAFGSALACAVGAARLLFAMSRDGFTGRKLGTTREHDGVPLRATTAVLVAVVLIIGTLRLAATSSITDIFFWTGTIGSLALLVAYLLCLTGAIRFLFFTRPRRARLWEICIPTAGGILVTYTLITNIYPIPDAPYNTFPYVVLAWTALGITYAIHNRSRGRSATIR
ncbi:APC family permease [Sciscionella marina]|uniref:APC family permease n=1 Tax=Sciscionella marina TaxID=508770 RepID=UPI000382EF0F|nr:APC family permease [Sciscionella marina]